MPITEENGGYVFQFFFFYRGTRKKKKKRGGGGCMYEIERMIGNIYKLNLYIIIISYNICFLNAYFVS